jgi:hypothetical protein
MIGNATRAANAGSMQDSQTSASTVRSSAHLHWRSPISRAIDSYDVPMRSACHHAGGMDPAAIKRLTDGPVGLDPPAQQFIPTASYGIHVSILRVAI